MKRNVKNFDPFKERAIHECNARKKIEHKEFYTLTYFKDFLLKLLSAKCSRFSLALYFIF